MEKLCASKMQRIEVEGSEVERSEVQENEVEGTEVEGQNSGIDDDLEGQLAKSPTTLWHLPVHCSWRPSFIIWDCGGICGLLLEPKNPKVDDAYLFNFEIQGAALSNSRADADLRHLL